jgi:hypothetical protein
VELGLIDDWRRAGLADAGGWTDQERIMSKVVRSSVVQSTSIGDPDTHRQYSSLIKSLRGRRLQAQFDKGGLPQAE